MYWNIELCTHLEFTAENLHKGWFASWYGVGRVSALFLDAAMSFRIFTYIHRMQYLKTNKQTNKRLCLRKPPLSPPPIKESNEKEWRTTFCVPPCSPSPWRARGPADPPPRGHVSQRLLVLQHRGCCVVCPLVVLRQIMCVKKKKNRGSTRVFLGVWTETKQAGTHDSNRNNQLMLIKDNRAATSPLLQHFVSTLQLNLWAELW